MFHLPPSSTPIKFLLNSSWFVVQTGRAEQTVPRSCQSRPKQLVKRSNVWRSAYQGPSKVDVGLTKGALLINSSRCAYLRRPNGPWAPSIPTPNPNDFLHPRVDQIWRIKFLERVGPFCISMCSNEPCNMSRSQK